MAEEGSNPTGFSRRDVLKILAPGGWVKDFLTGQELSRASKMSFALDAAIIAPLAVIACGGGEPLPARREELSEGNQLLVRELDNLPPSPIKNLLRARVKPFYLPFPQKSINYGSVEITVHNASVKLKTENTADTTGTFSLRGESLPARRIYPTKTVVFKFPYLGLMFDQEKAQVPPQYLAEDGTVLMEIIYHQDKPLQEGISPVITITAPDPSLVKPERLARYKHSIRFSLIKEACTQLLIDLWSEEIISKMQSLKLDPNIEVVGADGSKKKTEIVTDSIESASGKNGRALAAIDLASHLLAFKAVAGSDLDKPEYDDENFKLARPAIETAQLGDTARDILYDSLRWTLTTPEARYFEHFGNLDKIP